MDPYHFNADGLMQQGETLYDVLDGLQRGGVLPRDDSRQFHTLFAASKVPAAVTQMQRRLGSLLGRR